MDTWYVFVSAETRDESGKRRRFNRRIPLDRLPIRSTAAIKQWIVDHLPQVFWGNTVHVLTPLHHDTGTVDPDTRRFVYC